MSPVRFQDKACAASRHCREPSLSLEVSERSYKMCKVCCCHACDVFNGVVGAAADAIGCSGVHVSPGGFLASI